VYNELIVNLLMLAPQIVTDKPLPIIMVHKIRKRIVIFMIERTHKAIIFRDL